jgi:transcriptional regulator with XRE-family HTH domain
MVSTGVKALETPVARASARFSAELIRQLVKGGRKQIQIAGMLQVTKSFISRVAAGQRALTLEHLAMLERVLGKPIALLVLEGTARVDDAPERVGERERIRKLLVRPTCAGEEKPLSAAEQAEVDKLNDEIDARLSALSAQGGSPRANAARPRNRGATRVTKLQVVNLLQQKAGLSKAAARRAYQVQIEFAANRGLALFGT